MFKLPDSLNIYKIEEIRSQLLGYIETQLDKDENVLILDAEDTGDIDAAGVQLLLATYQLATAEGMDFKIKNKGQALKKLLLVSGVEQVWGVVDDE